jgi:hypothetical protein
VAPSTLYYSIFFLARHRTGHQAPSNFHGASRGHSTTRRPLVSFFSPLVIFLSTPFLFVVARYPQHRCRGGFSATCESVNTNAPHEGACVCSGMGHLSTITLACASRQSAECPCLVQDQSITADLLYSMHHRFSPIVVAYTRPSQLHRPKGVHAASRNKFPESYHQSHRATVPFASFTV